MMLNGRTLVFVAMSCGLALIPSSGLNAQQTAPPSQTQAQPAASQDQDPDLRKRERSDKEKIAANKALKGELHGAYKTWLNQDVVWIISDEEARAFKNLSNDEERDAFIENFWQRRNQNPDSPENEFREEHYRRIAYANEHFAAGKPGWRTDRGHIYISFGKPDSIDSHPSGGAYERPVDEGGGETSTFPFEVWHYRYLEGVGDNIDLEFVDTCQCGDYHFTIDRSEKDALLHVPGAGQTQWEEMGMAKKADRFNQVERFRIQGMQDPLRAPKIEGAAAPALQGNAHVLDHRQMGKYGRDLKRTHQAEPRYIGGLERGDVAAIEDDTAARRA